jgi:hypothetical protein
MKAPFGLLISCIVAGTVLLPAGSGNATFTGGDPDVSAGLPSSVTATYMPSAGGASSAAGAVITCGLNVQNPHVSTHVPETINVVARITCDAPVSRLHLTTYLYEGAEGTPYESIVAQGSNTTLGSASVQANAATACKKGTYHGEANGTVAFPPGYTPEMSTLGANGAQVSLSC